MRRMFRTVEALLIVATPLLLLSACNREPAADTAEHGSSGSAQPAPDGKSSGAASPQDASALAAGESSPSPGLAQAQALRQQGNLPGALELLRKELAGHPDDIALNREYQDVLRALGQTKELREEYARRLQTSSDAALSQYLYGRSVILESPAEAEAAFKKALEIDPRFLWAYLGLGKIHGNNGDNFAAVQTFEAALKQFPDSADLYFNLANSLYDIGALPKALDAVDQSLKRRPGFAPAFALAADIHFKQDEVERAREKAEKAIQLEPGNGRAHVVLAELDAKAGNLEQAKLHAQKALAVGQPVPAPLKAALKLQ